MRAFLFIKTILSSRLASALIIILSIAGRGIQKIHFTGAGGDKAFQVQATKNLVEGNGITIYETVANNLSQSHYVPLIKWPPGYSFFLSPFYSLCSEGQALWGSLWLDILSAILFVWVGRKIMLLLNLPVYIANIYCLISGFFLYEFCSYNSSDLIAIVLYQFAVYYTITFIRSREKKYSLALVIVFFLFCCGLIRYMFIPVAFIIPLYFSLSGVINKNKSLIRSGFFMLVSLAVLIASLLVFQKLYGGAAAYVMETQKGFYPEHLLRMNPFLFSSFINTELTIVQLEKITGYDYISIGQYIRSIHVLFLAALLFYFFLWVKRNKIPVTLTNNYIYIATFSSLSVLALLSFLSITQAPVAVVPPFGWSFIDEGRYFSVPIFFTQQVSFVIAYHYREKLKKWLLTLLISIFLVQLLMLAHSIYFTIQLVSKGPARLSERTEFNSMDYARHLLHKVIEENPRKNIVSAASEPMFNNFAYLWENIPGLYDQEKLNSLQLRAEKETIVFVSVQNRDEYKVQGFLNNPSKQLIGQTNDYRFYLVHVRPNQP